jgi:hypothetical protein
MIAVDIERLRMSTSHLHDFDNDREILHGHLHLLHPNESPTNETAMNNENCDVNSTLMNACLSCLLRDDRFLNMFIEKTTVGRQWTHHLTKSIINDDEQHADDTQRICRVKSSRSSEKRRMRMSN